MKKLFVTLALLSILIVCAACAAQKPPAPTFTPASAESAWDLYSQAQKAYGEADYEKALALSQQALTIDPAQNGAWELYRRASVAATADSYLSNLPSHRWRLPVDVFVRDQVNHGKDWFIVDVRTPEEFAKGHIDGAINMPMNDLMKHLDQLPNSKTAHILLYCHSQKRSTHAIVILHELGYSKAYHLEGGYAAYQDWMSQNTLPTPGPTPTPQPDEPDFGC
ncbi:MAG: hypothetical protein DSY55_02100 [Clostridia bacterium]|nr:MAG: hypothetical protein DSY55_02100 [Clostridia bacterium]